MCLALIDRRAYARSVCPFGQTSLYVPTYLPTYTYFLCYAFASVYVTGLSVCDIPQTVVSNIFILARQFYFLFFGNINKVMLVMS